MWAAPGLWKHQFSFWQACWDDVTFSPNPHRRQPDSLRFSAPPTAPLRREIWRAMKPATQNRERQSTQGEDTVPAWVADKALLVGKASNGVKCEDTAVLASLRIRDTTSRLIFYTSTLWYQPNSQKPLFTVLWQHKTMLETDITPHYKQLLMHSNFYKNSPGKHTIQLLQLWLNFGASPVAMKSNRGLCACASLWVSESMCFISCCRLFERSHDESLDKHKGMSTED